MCSAREAWWRYRCVESASVPDVAWGGSNIGQASSEPVVHPALFTITFSEIEEKEVCMIAQAKHIRNCFFVPDDFGT